MGSIGNAIALFCAWMLSGLLGWLQGGYATWFVFEALSVIVAMTVMIRFGALRQVSVHHELSAMRITEGRPLVVSVLLEHRSRVPVPWLLVEEEWRRSGDAHSKLVRRLLFPWFRSALGYQYTLAGLPRGEYTLVGVRATAADGLGFARRSRQAERAAVSGRPIGFVAYPLELPVPWRGSAGPAGEGRPSRMAAALSGAGGYPSGLRDYVPGDPVGSLHWKVTARRGKLTVKEAEPQEQQRVLLLLDTSAATYAALGDEAPEALESSVRAAAGLLRSCGERGMALAFACCHAGGHVAGGGPRERELLLERLARIDGKGALRFADTVAGEAAAQPAATALALVTPRVDEPLLAVLRSLHRRGRSVLLALPHAPELAAPEPARLAALRELGCDVLLLPLQRQDSAQPPLAKVRGRTATAQGGAAYVRG
ncbi:DUF58 domain-containing protein [Paenibacillus chartarius]|uniref:DUF58 domain-containing protein n=1 Tax=Paenibacillus chartarius TaxID=747481 RepID=A0ABV6DTG7_9BACL